MPNILPGPTIINALKRDQSSLGIWRTFFQHKKIHLVRQIHQRTGDEFVQWRKHRQTPRGKFPSKRTINLDLITLRRVLSWSVDKGLIPHHPLEKIPLFRQKKPDLPRYLTAEQIKLLESMARVSNKELWQAISVLVRTGMRSDELCSLEPGNIDFEKSRIILRPDQTKSGRVRTIPFAEKVCEILTELVEEGKKHNRKYLFHTRTGGKQTPTNLNRRLRTLLSSAERQGLMKDTRQIHIHTLRSTYISHRIMAGEEPAKIMEIVGHEQWSTMKRYLVFAPGYLVVGKLPY